MLFCNIITLAQNAPNKLLQTDLFAPFPTAANLAKYFNVPVTSYTSNGNTSIPNFKAEENDIDYCIPMYNQTWHLSNNNTQLTLEGSSYKGTYTITRSTSSSLQGTVVSPGFWRTSNAVRETFSHLSTDRAIG